MDFIQNDTNDKAEFETTEQIHDQLCSESVPALSSEYINPHIPRCTLGVYSSFSYGLLFQWCLDKNAFRLPLHFDRLQGGYKYF